MMQAAIKWLHGHKFEGYLLSFLLMLLPAIPLYFVAGQGSTAWIWALILFVIAGNLLALLII